MPSTPSTPGPRPADQGAWWPWLIPLATLAFHLITYRGYGFFRDELYYIASTEHLSFGYVEHPPGVVLVAWIVRRLFGDSLFAYRSVVAVVAAATVWLTGALAREMSDDPYASRLAETCTALAPGVLGMFGILSMNPFDVALWAACMWLAARWLRSGDDRLWIWFGLAAGIALQFKISILFLASGLAVGLVLAGRWRAVLTPSIWIGAGLAAALVAPFVWWQWTHGWPMLEFMANATSNKNVAFSPGAFLRETALRITPVAAAVAAVGAGALVAAPRLRDFRALGWALLAVLGLMLATNAKVYYLTPAYAGWFAAGSAVVASWTRGRTIARAVVLALTIATCATLIPFAKGVLSEDAFVAYQDAIGIRPAAEERSRMGRLPQHFADMHGWPELAAAVARVYHALPPADQARACVFGQNYGEAGAIDVFGRPLGLPPALSGHNSYWFWGPRGCTGDVLIVLSDRREVLERIFGSVVLGAEFHCLDCMPYENGLPIWVVRDPKVPLKDLWPRVKKFV